MFIGKILAGGGGKHPAFLIFLMQEKQTVQSEMGRANEHMDEKNREVEAILEERFGKDTLIALETAQGGIPYVRNVNAYYEGGAFYIITDARSNKMKHIGENPLIAIAGEWFTAQGRGENLGFFGKEENDWIAQKLTAVFKAWLGNGHVNLADENTVILRVRLTHGVLFSHGARYEF